jgi:hypothetical protein
VMPERRNNQQTWCVVSKDTHFLKKTRQSCL